MLSDAERGEKEGDQENNATTTNSSTSLLNMIITNSTTSNVSNSDLWKRSREIYDKEVGGWIIRILPLESCHRIRIPGRAIESGFVILSRFRAIESGFRTGIPGRAIQSHQKIIFLMVGKGKGKKKPKTNSTAPIGGAAATLNFCEIP